MESCTVLAASKGVFLLVGAGIYRSHLDLSSGSLAAAELAAEALQPSWLRWHPTRHDIMYCANEDRDTPTCSAYRVCAGGRLQLLNTGSTGASGPTHFSVSPDGQFLAVANYGGGALTVIPTADDGSLRPASTTVVHEGNGPNPKRQKEPHAHSANFSACGRFIFCCDLGIDQVVIYELRADGTVKRRYGRATPKQWCLLSRPQQGFTC
jgi:6-phosphogluconolactonase